MYDYKSEPITRGEYKGEEDEFSRNLFEIGSIIAKQRCFICFEAQNFRALLFRTKYELLHKITRSYTIPSVLEMLIETITSIPTIIISYVHQIFQELDYSPFTLKRKEHTSLLLMD